MSSATLLDIKQGEDFTITVILNTDEGKCYNLTGATEITATFNGTGGAINITLTSTDIVVVNAVGGEITIKITDTNTALLVLGTQSFEILVDEASGDKRIIQFLKCLNIIKRLL